MFTFPFDKSKHLKEGVLIGFSVRFIFEDHMKLYFTVTYKVYFVKKIVLNSCAALIHLIRKMPHSFKTSKFKKEL